MQARMQVQGRVGGTRRASEKGGRGGLKRGLGTGADRARRERRAKKSPEERGKGYS